MGKPGKDDCPNLKVPRSVLVLSCVGKVVEIVVEERRAEVAERRGLLSDGQYGSRNRRLAIDAAAIMVNNAHAAWREGHTSAKTKSPSSNLFSLLYPQTQKNEIEVALKYGIALLFQSVL
jgi:hypothetical protein